MSEWSESRESKSEVLEWALCRVRKSEGRPMMRWMEEEEEDGWDQEQTNNPTLRETHSPTHYDTTFHTPTTGQSVSQTHHWSVSQSVSQRLSGQIPGEAPFLHPSQHHDTR